MEAPVVEPVQIIGDSVKAASFPLEVTAIQTEDISAITAADVPRQRAGDVNVLVVDDDMSTLLITKKLLTKLGYNVTVESDPRKALLLIRSATFHLLLLDVSMPELSGVQVLKFIRRTPALHALAVVMLSCMSHPNLIYESVRCGADDYITKPVCESKLNNLVHHVWRRSCSFTRVKKPQPSITTEDVNQEAFGALDLEEEDDEDDEVGLYTASELRSHCLCQIDMYTRLLSVIDEHPHLFPGNELVTDSVV